MAISDETRDLLERCATLPRGLAFAHLAPIEAAAAALGVHPAALERLRAALDVDEARRELVAAYARAARHAAALARAETSRRERRPAAPSPRGPDEVIRAAQRHPLGPAFLREGPLEVVAIAFAVHPDVVTEARERMLDADPGQAAWPPQLLADGGAPSLRHRGV